MRISVNIKNMPGFDGVTPLERTLVEECIEREEELLEFFKLVMHAATFVVHSDERLELVKDESTKEEPSEHVPMSEESYEDLRHRLGNQKVYTENCDEEDCPICYSSEGAVDESPDSHLRNAQMLFADGLDAFSKAAKKAKKKPSKKKSSKKRAK